MLMGDGNAAFYDQGFYNIGVRPTPEDRGVGGIDPYGFDLSFTRQFKWRVLGFPQLAPDKFNVNACNFTVKFQAGGKDCLPTFSGPTDPQLRDAVDGANKTSGLRNVGLSPPYFHNGGQATLADVVRFYNRGGDRQGNFPNDTTGFGPTSFGVTNGTNLDPDIGNISNPNQVLGLTDVEQANLVAFMLSLTDNRVACHQGPFDHPQLPIPNGDREVGDLRHAARRDQHHGHAGGRQRWFAGDRQAVLPQHRQPVRQYPDHLRDRHVAMIATQSLGRGRRVGAGRMQAPACSDGRKRVRQHD